MNELTRPQIVIEWMAEAQASPSAVDDGRRKLRLLAMPHLFVEHGRIDRYVPEGATIAGHIAALGWPRPLQGWVTIDGRLIPEAQWEYVVPRTNQSLVIRQIPMGGGQGGDGGKMAMRIVGMLAFVALSIFTAGAGLPLGVAGLAGSVLGPGAAGFMLSGTASLMAGAVISVAGSLALNAVVPAPLPRRALPLPTPQKALKEAA